MQRVGYIDTLKGFAIIWIVWWHLKHPEFINPYYHVPLFFFISGIFFKEYPFRCFLKKKISSLLIPLVFFYLVAYVWRILVYYFVNRCWNAFDYSHIWDFFAIDKGQNYLFVNVPLWFIMSLFVIEFLYYFLIKFLPKPAIFLIAIGCVVMKEQVINFASPFMINNSLYWWTFFAFGHLFGGRLIDILKSYKSTIVIVVASALIYILCKPLQTYCFIIIAFAFFAWVGQLSVLRPIKYCGVNSLIIFGLHSPMNITVGHIIESFYHFKAPLWTGALEAFVTVVIISLLAGNINRCLSFIRQKIFSIE